MKSDSIIITTMLFFALTGIKCNWNDGSSVLFPTNASTQGIILQDIQPQYVVGHFTGKDANDTLRFQYFSWLDGVEITRIPSMENDWDSIIQWFNQTYQINSFIAYGTDTLSFESAYDLLCFFNIGDVNLDGVDEFAMVVNWLDYSNLNSCRIYSICNHKFSLLKVFEIHESAFLQEGAQDTSFVGIKDFLEKEHDVWRFREYCSDEVGENGEMEILQLGKCND
jgi:hypothetical protein